MRKKFDIKNSQKSLNSKHLAIIEEFKILEQYSKSCKYEV